MGWTGIGQLNPQSVQVAGIKGQDAQDAVVVLLALPDPAPLRISSTLVPGGSDQVAQSQLMNELPAFIQAYASGDRSALNRFLAPGVSVAGLAAVCQLSTCKARRRGQASRRLSRSGGRQRRGDGFELGDLLAELGGR